MTTLLLIIGMVLVFWGGFDLAVYMVGRKTRYLVYGVVTTLLGVINVLVAAGVLS